ncbi:YraN family protein [Chromatiales bacterium (ex Bugula neritina AB1)]|nr:YraN family protein [Chromatiales bacterium (ex Bugula neritina AB1)]
MTTRDQGSLHESLACLYLQEQGLTLLTSNHHSRFGEIDLIMKDGETIVFVEVRYRRNASFGGAALSITPAKQRKITLTALHYLQQKRKNNEPCRFDVFAVTGQKNNSAPLWIKNAFDASL